MGANDSIIAVKDGGNQPGEQGKGQASDAMGGDAQSKH